MDNYDTINTEQDRIGMANLIHSVCNLQYDDKQYVMVKVETNKQVYLYSNWNNT